MCYDSPHLFSKQIYIYTYSVYVYIYIFRKEEKYVCFTFVLNYFPKTHYVLISGVIMIGICLLLSLT